MQLGCIKFFLSLPSMNQNKKNIKIFFIYLAGLILAFHALTPHDHHYNATFDFSHKAEQSDNHQNNNPLHCFSFNDLITDKTGFSAGKVLVTKRITNIVEFNDIFAQTTENPYKKINFATKNDRSSYTIFQDSSPTRGSPFFKI